MGSAPAHLLYGDRWDHGAGFLCGYLESGVEAGLRYGAMNAALKLTFFGDVCWTTRSDLERHLDGVALKMWR